MAQTKPFKLSKEKEEALTSFLKTRFQELYDLRLPLDVERIEGDDLYNGIDKNINAKSEWEQKITIRYIFTIIQTTIARLKQTLFGEDNYIKIYVEDDEMLDVEKDIQKWIQEESDKLHIRRKSKWFLEEALKHGTAWLELRPIIRFDKESKDVKRLFAGLNFDMRSFYDVWYDIKARDISDSDVFIRKMQKLYNVMGKTDIYNNLDKLIKTTIPQDDLTATRFNSMYGESLGLDYDESNSSTRYVELLEWYGMYDISDNPDKPDFRNLICTLGNRTVLLRYEENTLPTKKKVLLFPLTPIKRVDTLIGYTIPELVKDLQYELNETRSLRNQNFKTLIKLLFSYNKNAGIDKSELFADGGNAIGRGDNPNDVTPMPIPNLINYSSMMIRDTIQEMQQITGAVDYVMGTSAGRGVTDTARGISTITEQALFRFNHMADNMVDDILDVHLYIMMLSIHYNREMVTLRYPKLEPYLDKMMMMLEDGALIDIGTKDLSQRRDIERSQFINAINVIAGLVSQSGGDMREIVRQILERFDVERIDKIMPKDEGINKMEQLIQALTGEQQPGQEQPGGGGGSMKANPQADKSSVPEEEAFNENI